MRDGIEGRARVNALDEVVGQFAGQATRPVDHRYK